MLSNCEKMVVISSTTNEWPQTEVDEKTLMVSTSRLMEKPAHQDQQLQQQQQQQALRCPRCDSSNTKFCYYNNYSLSQPRHFCKACKRYWTRGGTLRNVPVGGGCRKNKRVKRPASAVDGGSSTPSPSPNPTSQPQIDFSSSSNHINPLLYRLSGTPSDMNLPFSRFNSTVYDLQPQFNNAVGLGFSSNPLLSNYSIFGSSSSTATPTIASLLPSTLNQQKFINSNGLKSTNCYEAAGPFQNQQIGSNSGEAALTTAVREVKVEDHGRSRMEWNVGCQNQMEQIGLSDSAVYWNTTNSSTVGAWHDPGNIGSVTSLI
ncbi:hypothetical protein SLEP1_g22239 [Rubroshorea leprosula]|uniref:Dof zinc finger protein n=1 Tax=Rubroshorea leprosula TaxID=152421 RepID=A0AAV5JHU4_9ROSI|nr:hypothetical protein SLEP1_g22239 [Rubroshorea leprosula]